MTYKTRYPHLQMRVAHRVEICGCFIWSTQLWIQILHRCSRRLLSHVHYLLLRLSLSLYSGSRLLLLFSLMPDDTLIVPTVLPSGSLYFASVRQDGTVGDVINSLLVLDEVKSDILGDLPPRGWAIQLVRKASPGRQWEEDELESLGDGMYMKPLFRPIVQVPLQVFWTRRPKLLPWFRPHPTRSRRIPHVNVISQPSP